MVTPSIGARQIGINKTAGKIRSGSRNVDDVYRMNSGISGGGLSGHDERIRMIANRVNNSGLGSGLGIHVQGSTERKQYHVSNSQNKRERIFIHEIEKIDTLN